MLVSVVLVVFLLLLSSSENNEKLERGYVILRALRQAYPQHIDNFSFRSRLNDWGIDINGIPFNWAHGRVLPEHLASNYQKYREFGIYYYPESLPLVPPFSKEAEKKFLSELERNRSGVPIHESNTFRQALYQAPDKRSMDRIIQEIPFMEFRVKVHPMIIWPLKRVEYHLMNIRKQNDELERFFQSLRNISSYSWRKIQYFEKLSNHSFGTALDFLPKSWNGKAAYWNWVRDFREDWYNIPHEQRWSPPQILIDIFESQGFVWGGKWLYFDPMHFEYRPELFLLRNYLAKRSNKKYANTKK